jgi:dihydrofolate synthase/folylpolyglutamate synthase
MLGTKDATGFLRPLAPLARSLNAVSIPGEAATLTAEETVAAARAAGFAGTTVHRDLAGRDRVVVARLAAGARE